jgi:hypothetical protein
MAGRFCEHSVPSADLCEGSIPHRRGRGAEATWSSFCGRQAMHGRNGWRREFRAIAPDLQVAARERCESPCALTSRGRRPDPPAPISSVDSWSTRPLHYSSDSVGEWFLQRTSRITSAKRGAMGVELPPDHRPTALTPAAWRFPGVLHFLSLPCWSVNTTDCRFTSPPRFEAAHSPAHSNVREEARCLAPDSESRMETAG